MAAVCGLTPDRYRHETVTYGECSNVVRGKRRTTGLAPGLALRPVLCGVAAGQRRRGARDGAAST